MLSSILTFTNGSADAKSVLICIAAAIVCGFVISLLYMFKNKRYTKSMALTLILMPTLVGAIIMMVNGNLGAGIAVVGAFSLVRFRSIPGNARDIFSIFFAMAAGLATGMGYIVFAAIFTAVVSVFYLTLLLLPIAESKNAEKELRIIIPENLDFTDIFDEVLEKYTDDAELIRVKTTNLGSMFDLRYRVKLKKGTNQKEMIDAVRTLNGNLTVALGNAREDFDVL